MNKANKFLLYQSSWKLLKQTKTQMYFIIHVHEMKFYFNVKIIYTEHEGSKSFKSVTSKDALGKILHLNKSCPLDMENKDFISIELHTFSSN